jgi:hypothetical protein
MKLKNLKKKIRLLEVRLQKGEKKLGKLKRKLSAATTAGAAKTKKKKGRLTAKAPVKPAGAKKPSAAKKVKRTLNLSPERRAQLAAAMKARWAAKRAAVEPISQNISTNQDFTIQEVPQSA